MADSDTRRNEANDLSDIRRKLVWRIGFAVLMIIALLGGLALFDQLNGPADRDPQPPRFTEPVPVPKKAATQPLKVPESSEPSPSVPESSAAPMDKAAPPVLEPPPRPVVEAQPALPRPSAAAGRSTPAAGQAGALPRSTEVRTPATGPAPTAGPAAPTRAETANAASSPPPAPPRLFSGYALQAGVFADPRRAEELHARLVLEGIPSTIEARVQVGPFRNKEEAEAARLRLKTLGIESVLLPPKAPVKR